jgi:hypothetical protein
MVSSFSWILMLLRGFTLPIVDKEGAKNSCNLVTNNGLTAVADEFQRGTMLDDVIFQGVDKMFVCHYPIYISDLSVDSKKYHSSSRTIIDSWDSRVVYVISYILFTTVYIQSWVW